MAKEFWINLPVKNVKRSREFFSKLGFSFSPNHGNSNDLMGNKNIRITKS